MPKAFAPAPALPEPLNRAVCDGARRSKDARFDGVFFTAVRTTGIYCRPMCPAPTPKAGNVDYYLTAAAAEAAGFRPCLRCRPELSPADGAWRRSDDVVARALLCVEAGALDDAPVAALAARLHVGERHLRRLFVERLGTSPVQVQATRRLLFAKQLLTETRLPVTDIALAAGFRSVRRFNDAFLGAYGLAPGQLRRRTAPLTGVTGLNLRLGYRPPFDFAASLAFLAARALPGLEVVDLDRRSYTRLINAEGAWVSVTEWGRGEPALRLNLQGVNAADVQACVRRVRRMLDLDADLRVVHATLSQDPLLAAHIARAPGLRLPGGWDGLEMATRAVLGQQVSVAAARTLALRLMHKTAHTLTDSPVPGLHWLFPDAETLAAADLNGLGLTAARMATVKQVASAVAQGRVGFGNPLPLDEFIAQWCALPGIGEWTAHYLALRVLGHPDAFPAGDLVLRRQLRPGQLSTERALREHARAWQPWRAYAAIHLWHNASADAGATR